MKLNWKNIKPHTVVSIIMVSLVCVNYIMLALGKPVINLGEEQITNAVNIAFGLFGILYPVYKNQSVTLFAQYADEILFALRDGKISEDEIKEFIEKHKND